MRTTSQQLMTYIFADALDECHNTPRFLTASGEIDIRTSMMSTPRDERIQQVTAARNFASSRHQLAIRKSTHTRPVVPATGRNETTWAVHYRLVCHLGWSFPS